MNVILLTLMLAQMPNIRDLLNDVKAHQARLDEIRDNYTFHQTVNTEDLDGSGKVVKSNASESEVFFVNGRRVVRVVKRDGAPLSDTEQKKQTEEVKKQVNSLMKRPPLKRGPGLLTQILAVTNVTNPRRTTMNGRAALAYDFKGDPKAESHGLAQNALKNTAGTIWFDESEHQVIRAEIEFFENFRIGGGLLANVQKGSRVDLEQSPIGDGVWMQTATHQHLGLRVVFKGVRQNVQTRSFDFRRFDVGMTQQIGSPH